MNALETARGEILYFFKYSPNKPDRYDGRRKRLEGLFPATKKTQTTLCVRFVTLDNDVLLVGQCGGEKIDIASILELQALAQLHGRQGEIAHRDVGCLHIGQQVLDVLLAQGGDTDDAETPPREVGKVVGSYKEM